MALVSIEFKLEDKKETNQNISKVYSKLWEKEYPWVNPLEKVSLTVCFVETTSITQYQAEVV